MVVGERASRSQRRRWEEGRRQLARDLAPGLMLDAIRKRSLLELDLAADLFVPPLSSVSLAAVTGLAISGAAWACSLIAWPVVAVWALCAAMLGAYVARGVFLSGAGLRGFVDLAAAPVFIAWKILVLLRERRSHDWVRTVREGEQRP